MKNWKRLSALLLSCAIVAGLASGCSGEPSEAGSSGASEKKDVLTVAVNAEFDPWEILDSDNNPIGCDIDIINAIAAKLGKTTKIDNMEFDSVVGSVASGKYDLAISGLTITGPRKESIDMSDPYYEGAAQILITKKDDTLFTGTTKEELDEQLKNKRIGVCSGFTGYFYAVGDEEGWGFKKIEGADVQIYDNIAMAIQDLKNNKIDTIIMDDAVAKSSAASDENKDAIKVIDVPLTIESYAIGVKKGNEELLKQVNDALAELKSSGELQKMFDKWNIETK